MKKVSGRMIWNDVKRISENKDKEAEDNVVMAILLSSAIVGPNEKKISDLLKLQPALVNYYGKKIRKNKIWAGNKVDGGEWFDKKIGGVALICDTLVVLGLLNRSKVKNENSRKNKNRKL